MREEDRLQFETYLQERRFLLQGGLETRRALDRSLLTLSTGALALSFVYLGQLASTPATHAWLLFLSWWLFVGCVVCVLWSFRTSIGAFGRALGDYEENLQAGTASRGVNPPAEKTRLLNLASMAAFAAGVVAFLVFATINGGSIVNNENKEVGRPEFGEVIEHGATPPAPPLKPSDLAPAKPTGGDAPTPADSGGQGGNATGTGSSEQR